MNLRLYDKNMNLSGIIGGAFKSCLWSEGYNTCQPFSLEVGAEWAGKIVPDCYIGRDDRKTLMVVKSVTGYHDRIVATGHQATRVLDDVAFIGTIKPGQTIDLAVTTAYNKTSRYRALITEISSGLPKYAQQISNKSMLEICTTLCQATDTGYRITRGAKRMVLGFYQPKENPNLKFSEDFGNLSVDSVLESTEPLKNYAIVLGEGEGESRQKVIVDLTGGADKRELIVDARDLQKDPGETLAEYQKRLTARGVESLLPRNAVLSCKFLPDPADFGTRYDLGDILTVLVPEYGLKLHARIAKFTQKAQNNHIDTKIEVGDITIVR